MAEDDGAEECVGRRQRPAKPTAVKARSEYRLAVENRFSREGFTPLLAPTITLAFFVPSPRYAAGTSTCRPHHIFYNRKSIISFLCSNLRFMTALFVQNLDWKRQGRSAGTTDYLMSFCARISWLFIDASDNVPNISPKKAKWFELLALVAGFTLRDPRLASGFRIHAQFSWFFKYLIDKYSNYFPHI